MLLIASLDSERTPTGRHQAVYARQLSIDGAAQIGVSSQQSMTELTLTAIFEEVEEGGFIGYVAELPGANTQGETLEAVRETCRRRSI